MVINVKFKNLIILLIIVVNILWILLVSSSLIQNSILLKKDNLHFSKIITDTFTSYLNNPILFEEDKKLDTTQFHYLMQSSNLDNIIKEKYVNFIKNGKAKYPIRVVYKRLYEQFLYIGLLYEKNRQYIYAREYFKRGFDIAHYISSKICIDRSFMSTFSQLRLRYKFYENNLLIFNNNILLDSMFYYYGTNDICKMEIINKELNKIKDNSNYRENRLYGLGVSIYNSCIYRSKINKEISEVSVDILYDVYRNYDGTLEEESLYMMGKIFKLEKNYFEMNMYFNHLVKVYPNSYLADDILLELMFMNKNDKEKYLKYKSMLLNNYKERDSSICAKGFNEANF